MELVKETSRFWGGVPSGSGGPSKGTETLPGPLHTLLHAFWHPRGEAAFALLLISLRCTWGTYLPVDRIQELRPGSGPAN